MDEYEQVTVRLDCLKEAVHVHQKSDAASDGLSVLTTARLFNDFVQGNTKNG